MDLPHDTFAILVGLSPTGFYLTLYVCEGDGGTDHAPLFQATVRVGELDGNGRRRAEAAAARMLLSIWPQ